MDRVPPLLAEGFSKVVTGTGVLGVIGLALQDELPPGAKNASALALAVYSVYSLSGIQKRIARIDRRVHRIEGALKRCPANKQDCGLDEGADDDDGPH